MGCWAGVGIGQYGRDRRGRAIILSAYTLQKNMQKEQRYPTRQVKPQSEARPRDSGASGLVRLIDLLCAVILKYLGGLIDSFLRLHLPTARMHSQFVQELSLTIINSLLLPCDLHARLLALR